MKRIIGIFFMILLLTSLALSQEMPNVPESMKEKQFQPPEWIRGSWSNFFKTTVWEFTENDILLNKLSFLETYGTGAILNRIATDTEYDIAMKIGETAYVYVFEKVSETKITYTRYSDGQEVGPVELASLAPDPGSPFTPPAWIQGTWLAFDGDEMWTFTGDDVVSANTGASYKNSFNPENITILVSDGSEYTFEVSDGGTYQKYRFKKVSDNDLKYTLASREMEFATLKLIKK